MAFTLSRVDRVYRDYTVTATNRDGTTATLTGVDVALLPPRTSPSGTTVWTATSFSAGKATVLLSGPDADDTGALPVPAAGADVWLRVTSNPEVDAELIERILIV